MTAVWLSGAIGSSRCLILHAHAARRAETLVIRPADFDPARLPAPPALAEVVRSCAVRLAGCSFPETTALGDVAGIGPDWVDRASEWWRYLEYWRFYRSGLFVDFAGVRADWLDRPRSGAAPVPPGPGWRPGSELWLYDTVRRCIGIFAFAARLAALEGYAADRVVVTIMLHGLAGRELVPEDPAHHSLPQAHRATMDTFAHTRRLTPAELIANPAALGRVAAGQLFFERFGQLIEDAALAQIRVAQD